MLRKALDAKADVIVFIDHDVSWDAKDLLTLIQTEGDVVAGTYRFKKYNLSVDLFNHGAHKGTWYGEDYAFSRNWIDCGGEIWTIPFLNINHHSADEVFEGNLHTFLRKQSGGDLFTL